MSDSRNNSEPPVSTDSVTSHDVDDVAPEAATPAKAAPWTSETPRVPGPAPMIELDTPVDAEPVKPLGPRRLARLQRQMAEHVREIQEAEQHGTGEVDPDLLIKQQRLAELALRAAAANQEDRQAAANAIQAADASEGHGPADGAPNGDEGEQITVVFPQTSAAGSPLAADPVASDPAQFPSSPVDFTSAPGTTSIQVLTGMMPEAAQGSGLQDTAESTGSTAYVAENTTAVGETDAETVAEDIESAEGVESDTEAMEDHDVVAGEEWTPEDEVAEEPTAEPDPGEVADPAQERESTETAETGHDEDEHGMAAWQVDLTEHSSPQDSEPQHTAATSSRDARAEPVADPDHTAFETPETSETGGLASQPADREAPSVPADQINPPATPVRALDAEGLELLEPHDYRQSSGAVVPLLVGLFLLLAVIVILLIMFVL